MPGRIEVESGGVAILPNDVIVADTDGAVLIPAALLDAVIEASVEQVLEWWQLGRPFGASRPA